MIDISNKNRPWTLDVNGTIQRVDETFTQQAAVEKLNDFENALSILTASYERLNQRTDAVEAGLGENDTFLVELRRTMGEQQAILQAFGTLGSFSQFLAALIRDHEFLQMMRAWPLLSKIQRRVILKQLPTEQNPDKN